MLAFSFQTAPVRFCPLKLKLPSVLSCWPRVMLTLLSLIVVGEACLLAASVNPCTDAALRTAVHGGGTITFACDGTIVLTNTIRNLCKSVLNNPPKDAI
jgi:hypothetical protein